MRVDELERRLADAEQQAKDKAADLVCCEAELAALKTNAQSSSSSSSSEDSSRAALAQPPADGRQSRQHPQAAACSLCAEKDRKMAEIKEKAKLFVRDKLGSVQQHLLIEEQHHNLFVERVRALLTPGTAAPPSTENSVELTAAEMELLVQLQKQLQKRIATSNETSDTKKLDDETSVTVSAEDEAAAVKAVKDKARKVIRGLRAELAAHKQAATDATSASSGRPEAGQADTSAHTSDIAQQNFAAHQAKSSSTITELETRLAAVTAEAEAAVLEKQSAVAEREAAVSRVKEKAKEMMGKLKGESTELREAME
eukprot:SAG31_NODE_8138_length_1513_cov_2.591938_1_plen_312_part_10